MGRLGTQGGPQAKATDFLNIHPNEKVSAMNLKKIAVLGILAGLGATTAMTSARADELQDIKSKGVLVVGVKADYPPFGFLNSAGQNVGIEPDLARDLAKRLGVKIQFV